MKQALSWNTKVAAKPLTLQSSVKAPLQPSQVANKANVDQHASQKMGPPAPKKPPTKEQIVHARVAHLSPLPYMERCRVWRQGLIN